MLFVKYILTFYLIETPLMLLQTEQTRIRQLIQELPDHGLLCLLMEIWYIWSYTSGSDK